MDIENAVRTILAVILAVVVPIIGLLISIEITGVNPFTRLAAG